MPVYTPPNFNAFLDVWVPPATPATAVATFTNVSVQVYVYSRTPELMLHPASGRWLPVIIIRVPFATSVTITPDWIYKANGSLPQGPHYYKVQYIVEMHTGFPNQYYALYCLQCNANGTIPRTPLPT